MANVYQPHPPLLPCADSLLGLATTATMATSYVPLLTNHFGQFNQTKAADLYPDTDFDGLNVLERLWGESSRSM